MKQFLPSKPKLWASAGMMLVIVIALFAKGPFWILAAALICILTLLALRWSESARK